MSPLLLDYNLVRCPVLLICASDMSFALACVDTGT